MLKIAIVEDDKIQSELIEKYVMEWGKGKSILVKVLKFISAENFKFELDDNPDIDILLLDIQLGEMNGMELAKELRQQNNNLKIVFITAVVDFIQEGYDVKAVNYLIKPVKKVKLFECLNTASEEGKSDKKYFVFDIEGAKIKIKETEIIFIEAVDHNLRIKTTSREYVIRKKFSDIQKNVSSDFMKTHRSFLVNISHINKIQKKFLITDDGTKIPISRNEYVNVKNSFVGFFTKDSLG